jgi:peptide-N4-(N-acetyl-beta-glucosaminyl)asparagine amidase
LQAKALGIIPVERLKEKSREKFNEYKENAQKLKLNFKEDEELEFFLLELLVWYKTQFFQWVNEPDCDNCQTKEFMAFNSSEVPTENELIWGARNVEVYK